jgi:hypothetical protein
MQRELSEVRVEAVAEAMLSHHRTAERVQRDKGIMEVLVVVVLVALTLVMAITPEAEVELMQ